MSSIVGSWGVVTQWSSGGLGEVRVDLPSGFVEHLVARAPAAIAVGTSVLVVGYSDGVADVEPFDSIPDPGFHHPTGRPPTGS